MIGEFLEELELRLHGGEDDPNSDRAGITENDLAQLRARLSL